MHLIQILLPVYDKAGARFPQGHYDQVADELTERFGGLTAYVRAPAAGLWQEDTGRTRRDDIVVYEVMAETLDRSWWRSFRKLLERRFEQDELVVRSQEVERL